MDVVQGVVIRISFLGYKSCPSKVWLWVLCVLTMPGIWTTIVVKADMILVMSSCGFTY